MAGRGERGVLVDLLLGAVAVHPGGAAVHHPPDSGPPRRVQHVEGPAGVDLFCVRGLGQDVLDIGDRCQVDHGMAAGHRQPQCLDVEQAA